MARRSSPARAGRTTAPRPECLRAGGMSPCAAVRTDRGRPRGGDAPSPTRIDSKLEMRVDCGGAKG